MAKKSAHGAQIGQLDYGNCRVAYMADGHILKATPQAGWKLYKKLKPGVDPLAAYGRALERYSERVALIEFARQLNGIAAFNSPHRIALQVALDLEGHDVDAMTANLQDHGLSVTYEDCRDLVAAMEAFKRETEEISARRAAATTATTTAAAAATAATAAEAL